MKQLVIFAFLIVNVEAACDPTYGYETATCLDGSGNCHVRCTPDTPLTQVQALSGFATACGADNWHRLGYSDKINWCDGIVDNNACTEGPDVVRDPCTGELLQTPDSAADSLWTGSYDYTPTDKVWAGVDCIDGEIASVVLKQYAIGAVTSCDLGSFDLSPLATLSTLNLDLNFLIGTIPAWVSSMPALTTLSATNNRLSGSIPADFFDNQRRRQLTLRDSPSLVAEKSAIAQRQSANRILALDGLSILHLGSNSLTGALPALADTLVNVELQGNSLSGSLPPWPSGSQLQNIDISNNDFSGTIPNIGNLTLDYFLAPGNSFTGPLQGLDGPGPASLILLDLADNSLTGPIDPAISGLGQLTSLNLGGNAFTGFLPLLPANLTTATFVGPGSSFLCPFPDANPLYSSVSCNCSSGYYCPTSDRLACQSSCTVCPTGTASAKEWAVGGCDACAAGSHAPAPALTVCSLCNKGKFVNSTGASQCDNCTLGRSSIVEGAGADGGQCALCARGQFSSRVGLEECEACVAGTVAGDQGQRSCDACPRGKEGKNTTTCSSCSTGRFSSVLGLADCTLCDAGRFSSGSGAVNCSSCLPGSFAAGTGNTACDLCEPGTAEAGFGSAECGECAIGRAQNVSGKTSCFNCGPGLQPASDAKSCINCPAGKKGVGTAEGRDIYCSLCDAGRFSIPGSSSCDDCLEGTVALLQGSPNCSDCPAGKTSESALSCVDCSRGTYSGSGSPCLPCPKGTVGTEDGQAECTVCDAGRFTVLTGLKGDGSNCSACPVGTYLPDAATNASMHDNPSKDCLLCPEGRFGNATAAESCVGCPLGKTLAAPDPRNFTYFDDDGGNWTGNFTGFVYVPGARGRDSEEDCSACDIGRYSDVRGAYPCEGCPAGRYGDEVGGASLDSACLLCARGTYTALSTSTVCLECPPRKYQDLLGKSFCHTVFTGSFFVNATHAPKKCSTGTFSDTEGATNCTECPAGSTSADVSANTGPRSCVLCRGGRYAALSASPECTLLPAGYAHNDTGREAVVASTDACHTGKYQDLAGQRACKVSPPGRYVPASSTDAFTQSFACPAGSYSQVQGSTGCVSCPQGHACVEESSEPLVCIPGLYAEAGSSICKLCASGQYQPSSTQEFCLECPAGRYQPTPGSAKGPGSGKGCFLCPSGTVAVANGSRACGYCGAATYPNKPGGGATECVSACGDGEILIGFEDNGAAKCQGCPADTFQADTVNGRGECEKCPRGYDTKGAEKVQTCSVYSDLDTGNGGDGTDMVAGFDLNDPTQAGSFYSVVSMVGLIAICGCVLVGQMMYKSSVDHRRSHERMSRVSKGIWDESYFHAIPEYDESVDGPAPPPPKDNPHMFVKKKTLKSKTSVKSVEASYISELLKDDPPAGCCAFVVVAPSAPVRQQPLPGSSEVCRKYKGEVVHTSQAAGGWVQLHVRHGERHGGGGWMSVRRWPARAAPGLGAIQAPPALATSEFDPGASDGSEETKTGGGGRRRQSVVGGMMQQAADAAKSKAKELQQKLEALQLAYESGGLIDGVMGGAQGLRDGFTPLRGREVEAEFFLVPCDLGAFKEEEQAGKVRSTGAGGDGSVVDSSCGEGAVALRKGAQETILGSKGLASKVKMDSSKAKKGGGDHMGLHQEMLALQGKARRGTIALTQVGARLASANPNAKLVSLGSSTEKASRQSHSELHREQFSTKASQGWWVGLTESLGLFADDGEAEKQAAEALRVAEEAEAASESAEIATTMAKPLDPATGRMNKKDTARIQFLMRKARNRVRRSQGLDPTAQASTGSDGLDGEVFVGGRLLQFGGLVGSRLRSAAAVIGAGIGAGVHGSAADSNQSRLGYVDDAGREVTCALLAERANVSVLRVIEVPDAKTLPKGIAPVRAPVGSRLPPAAHRLTRPPIDIPDTPNVPGLADIEGGDGDGVFPEGAVLERRMWETAALTHAAKNAADASLEDGKKRREASRMSVDAEPPLRTTADRDDGDEDDLWPVVGGAAAGDEASIAARLRSEDNGSNLADGESNELRHLGLHDSSRYEVAVGRLEVKVLPNVSSATKRIVNRGEVVEAVECRGGWVNLKSDVLGSSGGWAAVKVKASTINRGNAGGMSTGRTKFDFSAADEEDGDGGEGDKLLGGGGGRKQNRQSVFAAAASTLLSSTPFSSPLASDDKDSSMASAATKQRKSMFPVSTRRKSMFPVSAKNILGGGGGGDADTVDEDGYVLCLRLLAPGEEPSYSKDAMPEMRSKKEQKQLQEWHMPKRVAVVRLKEETRQQERGGCHSSGSVAGRVGGGAPMPSLPPPPLQSLPAVFAVHRDEEDSFSSSSGSTGCGGDTPEEGSSISLDDLPPLDLPLAPQPCPVALSLIDLTKIQDRSTRMAIERLGKTLAAQDKRHRAEEVAKTQEVLANAEAQKKAKLLATRKAVQLTVPDETDKNNASAGGGGSAAASKFRSAAGIVGAASGFVKELQFDSALTSASTSPVPEFAVEMTETGRAADDQSDGQVGTF